MQETPMLKQYHSIKNRHRDCILFFRLGDFYEMFYEDAHVASRALDLVLTSRGKAPSPKVPMCGIPYHAAENYIAKLIKSGHKVAICEQVEDPAAAKGLVERDVIRVITSGTYLDEHNSDPRILLCLSPNGKSVGLAFSDPATGAIQANQYPFNQNRLVELIANLPVHECVYPQAADETIRSLFTHPLLKSKHITLSPYDDWCFNPDIAQKALCDHFAVRNLYGFGIEDLPQAASSSGALLEYLKQMNKQPLRHMDKITLYTDEEYVFISPAAFRGLEIDTLVKTLDETLNPLGRRALRFWITHPLKDPGAITNRQDAVQLLLDNPNITQRIKACLEKIPDVEKNISRLSCGLTHAKDLLAVRNTLALVPEIKQALEPLAAQNDLFTIEDVPSLRERLEAAVNEDIPLSHPEGKIIKSGYHNELDALRGMQENGRQWLKKFQEEEIKRTGINSLKVGFNHVFGYYIEITKANLRLAPEDYIRRQTLVNAERFITPGLKEYEEKILTAQEKILKIENEIVQEIRQEILNHSLQLHGFCQAIATIDALYSFAALAQTPHYIAPEIADDTLLEIKEGRHPVVEKTLAGDFIANDTLLDCGENHLIILTGPNMSGKSTYIRQTAILTILAQAGSFIPADAAHIGIVDKIFTRIGAHDDIAKGQSTFMVEMNETAGILNNLTDKSLVILDEIGRGTSTYDGLSLAWALAEHLKDTKVRCLFATHFHELTALADEHEGVRNYNVAVKEWKDEVIFLHKIVPGSADDSYGIYVAKLAGIPAKVIARAKHILTQLELKNDLKEDLKTGFAGEKQFDLFTRVPDPTSAVIRETIESMDVNAMTPLEALNKVQELKEILNENPKMENRK
jgi:DNA mismatch repair protein MutS